MTSADQRGWGPGWPNCQTSKMAWITAGGIQLFVRKEVAPIFAGFCNEVVAKGYPLGAVADDWGFACRPIRGTQIPSNHSWGLAIDLNSTANPMGSTLKTDMPVWMIDLAKTKYGLDWGGNYKTRPDPMHFEFLGTPAEASMIVAQLSRLTAAAQPTVTPAPFIAPAPQEIPMFVIRRVEDGAIAYSAGPGHWRELNPEQSVVAHALCKVTDAIPVNARQWDVAKDLQLGLT